MKKIFRLLVELLVIVLLALLTLPAGLLAQQKTKTPKVGFCLDDYNAERWHHDRDIFVSKVKELGGEVVVEVAYSETEAQIKQIRKMVEEGVQVIVIVPSDGNALTAVIAEAKKKGVKIIAYDRMIMQANIDYYISYDSEMVGELMATYMVKQKPNGAYAILSGPDSDTNAGMYRNGQLRVLQPHIDKGNIQLVYDDKVGEWTEMDAMIQVNEFLDQYTGKLDVVLAANDGLASGVIMALNDNGRAGTALVSGQDAELTACKLIYKGEQAMTIYKPVNKLATEAAILAVQLANGQPVKAKMRSISNGNKKVASLLFAPIAIDRHNMAATVLKDYKIAEHDLMK
ncbi:D-xylose transporter subunit XylF [Flammeovirgaceae bacterium 311]|nr:D-xylose transporter subunit XylF [Flammeovirgaceae bacterium 311]